MIGRTLGDYRIVEKSASGRWNTSVLLLCRRYEAARRRLSDLSGRFHRKARNVVWSEEVKAKGRLLARAGRRLFQRLALNVFPTLFIALHLSAIAIAGPDVTKEKVRSAWQAATSRTTQVSTQPKQNERLLVIASDENGVPIPSARVTLTQPTIKTVLKGETDYAGRCQFAALNPGLYQLRAEKEGFYAVTVKDVLVGETESVEITLHHQREYFEVVTVVYSPPAIDPEQTGMSESLTSREIVNVPYPVGRDIRSALPLIPGVLRDASGQVHVDGSAAYQTFYQLDGFNITHPKSGLFEMRVNTDAIRSLEVHRSRYSAEYGKGSGGVLSLATGMGDDRYRWSATDFIPRFQSKKGVDIDNWTPRVTFSGPLRRRKAWFFEAVDGEYGLDIVEQLPPGGDRRSLWRLSNLTKLQVNINRANILNSSFLVNRFHAQHVGLSQFNPLETTRNQEQAAYLFTLKEQSYFSRGVLLETGLGVNGFRSEERPRGDLPYVIRPERTSGNYFRTTEEHARRFQWLANLIVHPIQWHGRHEFKLGTDIDRITYHQLLERRPILILREDGTLSREITFVDNPRFGKNSLEVTGFAQDRWSLSDRLLLELGLRFDWDNILRQMLVSPRLASSFQLASDTKLAAGVGVFYDSTNLDLLTRPFAGRRFDVFYASDGQTPIGPQVETSFQVDVQDLKAPRSLNWSLGLEQKLPSSIYLSMQFMQKRGSNGWAFVKQRSGSPDQPSNLLQLRNRREDRYDSIQITMDRTFKDGARVFASYTRSAARSSVVFDFADIRLLSQEPGGPLPWDAPNRLVSWGWLPPVKAFQFAYSLEWRDGFPFSLVDQDQQLVGSPYSQRFPTYFSLNLAIERRFRLLGFQWALRVGLNNVTDRQNPTEVINNVDSPQFLTFGGSEGRALRIRIRFLGRL